MGEQLLTRARQLLVAGPYDARASEIAAVHAAIYPKRDAVCQTCPRELGPAFYAIQRWAAQQEAAGDAPHSLSPMKKGSPARFASDTTIYTPHGLGVAYSNANLTDSAARAILKADPDAAALFSTLPAEEEVADEDAADTDTNQPASPAAADPTATGLSDADLDKLTDKVAARLAAGLHAPAPPAVPAQPLGIDGQPVAPGADPEHVTEHIGSQASQEDEPALTVSRTQVEPAHVEVTTGSVVPTDADEPTDDKPVRLSRMGKDQLRAAHLAEVGTDAPADATNDELREAIAAKRASLPTE